MNEAFLKRARWITVSIILCNFIYWFSRSAIRPAFPMLLHDKLSPDTLGLLLSMQSFLPIFFSLSAGSMGDRFGHARVLVVGAFCSSVSLFIYYIGFLDTTPEHWVFPLWSIGMVLSGMAWLFFWIALQSLATKPLDEHAEGKIPSVAQMIYALSLTMSFGLILGPMVTGYILDWWNADVFWITQLCLSFVHAGISLWLAKLLSSENKAPTKAVTVPVVSASARSAYTLGFPEFVEHWSTFGGRPYVSVLLVSFLALFSVDLVGTFVPAQLGDAGMSESNIGYVLISGPVAGIILRLVLLAGWVRMSDKVGLRFAIGLSVFGLAMMAVLPPNFSWMIVGISLGLAVGISEPVTMKMVASFAAEERRGLALGGRALANRVGMFLAPFLAFSAFANFGPLVGGFLLSAGVAVVGVIAIYLFSAVEKD